MNTSFSQDQQAEFARCMAVNTRQIKSDIQMLEDMISLNKKRESLIAEIALVRNQIQMLEQKVKAKC